MAYLIIDIKEAKDMFEVCHANMNNGKIYNEEYFYRVYILKNKDEFCRQCRNWILKHNPEMLI